MEMISVIIADDHKITRMGIRRVLEMAPDIQVVGEAKNGYEALLLVNDLHADVIILDVEMPVLTGVEVSRILHGTGTPIQVLILSAYKDRAYVEGVLHAGAAGYLTKDEAPNQLVNAVRGISHGEESWFSEKLMDDIGINSIK